MVRGLHGLNQPEPHFSTVLCRLDRGCDFRLTGGPETKYLAQ